MNIFNYAGNIPSENRLKTITIQLDSIEQGASQTEDLLIFRNEEVLKIYSRNCDHSMGKLFLKGEKAICPLHGWEFSPESGGYCNIHQAKDQLDFQIEGNSVICEIPRFIPQLPTQEKHTQSPLKIDFIEHACLIISTKDFSFATDPWVVGPAFAGGWWTANDVRPQWGKMLNAVDFIYISHNHPDHLNKDTLKHVRRNMPFIVPNFASKSVETMLKQYGFTNIHCLDFGNYYQYGSTPLNLAILKSGDFRDDSGLYFSYGEFSFLSPVDSNNLNFGNLPEKVTVLASSFAGGSSGFPLCFEMLSALEKTKITTRNRNAMRGMVKALTEQCNPAYYMPYAGFFSEKAERDRYIREHNTKNQVKNIIDLLPERNVINLLSADTLTFKGSTLVETKNSVRELSCESPEIWINQNMKSLVVGDKEICTYFRNSRFHDDLVLFLSICDDLFTTTKQAYRIDFTGEQPDIQSLAVFDWNRTLNDRPDKVRFLSIKVREDAFNYVIKNRLPWEDLFIGFQCRISRFPDIYNVKFWYHFTNKYIGSAVYSDHASQHTQ